ncbi:MAG: carboxypeptidase-like regulatory domain-containing protein, partial [Planctomycetaceae bacterium]
VSNDYVSIDTGGSSFESTQEIDLRIALRDLEERPADGVTADALISRDGRVVTMISLNADGRIPGIYRGRISSLPPGEYEVRIQADGYSDEALQVATGFTVRAPISGELAFTSANRMLLERMSDAAGGRLLEEEEIGDLPELLSAYSDGRIVESETLLWQSYWWFLPIVSLLSLEWMLRRRAGLM